MGRQTKHHEVNQAKDAEPEAEKWQLREEWKQDSNCTMGESEQRLNRIITLWQPLEQT